MPLSPRAVTLRSVSLLALALGASGCLRAGRPSAPAPATSARDAAVLGAERGAVAGSGTIGVPPFAAVAADPTLTSLSYALADLLNTDLSRSSRVRVVERTRLGEVLRELDLAQSGRVDSATAPRVGRLVQAERLVLGSVGTLPDGRTLRIGARIGNVAQGTVAVAVDAQAPLAQILEAEKALVFRLFDQLGVQLTPAERAAIQDRPTQNLQALLAYGRGVEKEFSGDLTGARREFRDAQRVDPGFRAAGTRAQELQVRSEGASATPTVVPGVRPLAGVVGAAIDRVNQPLPLTAGGQRTTTTPADPSFPSTQVTVLITVIRP